MSTKDDFKYTRWFDKLNLYLQILLSITLVIGLNYLCATYHKRFDITRTHKYTLSEETIAYLKKIDTPIQIIVTISPHSLQKEVHNMYYDLLYLLREYEHINPKHISINFIDLFQQRGNTHPLVSQYNINQENQIYIINEAQQRKITATELYKRNQGDLVSFMGEQVVTSAILDISNQLNSKIYFVTGHGEMYLYSTDPAYGLSEVHNFLRERNFLTDTLNLKTVSSIPSDADLIIIPNPQAPFLPEETAMLQQYIEENNGRCILLLKPFLQHGLNGLLLDWGIQADEMVVVDDTEAFQTLNGDFLTRNFSKHATTKALVDYQLSVLSSLPKPVHPINDSLSSFKSVTSLMESSSSSWVESSAPPFNKNSLKKQPDISGPISIAVISEKNINNQVGLKIPSGKLAVFGNGDFINNTYLNLLGNKILFINTINWCLENSYSLNIPPKNIKKILIPLSQQNITEIGLSFIGMATFISLLGIIIIIRRQK